jgi:hypothetical protein
MGTRMVETDDRMQSEGQNFFIIGNGEKIAKHEAGTRVPLLPMCLAIAGGHLAKC